MRLPSIEKTDLFIDFDGFGEVLGKAYQENPLRAVSGILFSVEFLGNPMMLYDAVKKGLTDFALLPVRCAQQEKAVAEPGARNHAVACTRGFMKGVAKGTLSLVGNTIIGMSDAASRITQQFGRGFASVAVSCFLFLPRLVLVVTSRRYRVLRLACT